MYSTKTFIEQFVCTAGESVEQLGTDEWEIQRWTARTFKNRGNVLAAAQYDTFPPEEIQKLKLTPRARRASLPISTTLLDESLHKGWIIEEIRFMKDGRTPQSKVYRMGPGLYAYEQMKKEKEEAQERSLRETMRNEIEKMNRILPDDFLQAATAFATEPKDHESWGKDRVRRFCHFLIAYFRLKREKDRMEFKEIGATYYREIGGSKAFDSNREVFIERMEKWLRAPIYELGIISIGSIVPLYFAGNLNGKFSTYTLGTVHATTDIAIADEQLHTNATTLWLVENRAVLTRMAEEVKFMRQTNAFVLGVDGQIRGAHRKMIGQMCSNRSIEQVMIWVDYDRAGHIIARDLVQLVGGLPYRIIGNEGNVFITYDAYIDWAKTTSQAEQEMTLGGVDEWKRWSKR